MANTTNFGWETPDDTDLVKDGASAMRTLGNSIDTSMGDLKGGTTGQILTKNSNTDMDFIWNNSSGISATIVDAKGDLIAATAADTVARLGVGTNGQILTADSTAATGLKWATPASGGKVLQVVNTTSATSTYSQSSTYTDVGGASLSITPTSATSKILVLAFLPNVDYRNTSNAELDLQLTDGSNNLITMAAESYGVPPTNARTNTSITLSWLHSPATTSAFTYKFRMRSKNAVNGVYVNNGSGTYISITLLEIGA